MRVLVLGGTGMLGHKLWQICRQEFDTWVTVRDSAPCFPGLFDPDRTLTGVDGADADSLAGVMAAVRPDVVVNAIGIVKQRPAARDAVASILINALLPHRLATLCRAAGARLVHISTDCVYSGRRGNYLETDPPDAEDLYGRTKFLGEVAGDGCLTLRTSIIGRELRGTSGLLEWFLSQRHGRVQGYTRARFSGMTTIELSRLIVRIIRDRPELNGLYHAAADAISKHDLLAAINEIFGLHIHIEPSDAVVIDRTLNGQRLGAAVGFAPPSWRDMLNELHEDSAAYENWRAR